MKTLFTQLPAIDSLLRQPAFQALSDRWGHSQLVALLRQLQQQARDAIQQHQRLPAWCSDWAQHAAQQLQQTHASGLQPVLNLSGTLLHTNLGRAQLAEAAVSAVCRAMRSPVTLEYALDEAQRGHRDRAVADLLCRLTGAEDACIVNNNAAAVLLMLGALAAGKEVVVSRGELVEIGGSFRIPDVMTQAGCTLREVGTTNRTHLKDYRHAVSAESALLMKVHTSNYAVTGFTKSVPEAEVAAIAHARSLPLAVDLGSGTLVDMAQWGLPQEPTVRDTIAAGADLVTFSGDKLLGGPQAGLIVGRKDLIAKIKKNPLKRALRVGKLTLAALEPVLRLYLAPEHLAERLTTLRLFTRTRAQMQAQAERLLPAVQQAVAPDFDVAVAPMASQIGSGALPVDTLPSAGLRLTPREAKRAGRQLARLEAALRGLPRPVIGRIADQSLWLDLRCLEAGDEPAFGDQLAALRTALAG